MPEPADEIILELPLDPVAIGVARLVVGGLGARLDLPFEALDDLQLVVETVLSAETADGTQSQPGGRMQLVARVAENRIDLELFPIASDLASSAGAGAAAGLTLDQICTSLVDRHSLIEEAGSCRLHLEKTIPVPTG